MEPIHDQRRGSNEARTYLKRFWVAFLTVPKKLPRPMSQHPSLKGQGTIKAKRSVLKRFERVELLKKRGQYTEGQRVIGLPKTKPEE
jgi:small basic protein (TIGR04137 family)